MWVDKEDDTQKNNQNTANVGAGGGTSAPIGSNTQEGNPSTISPVSSNQPQQNFATVQDYLGANKQQGEELGQKVASNLTGTQNQEKRAIDSAAIQTKSQINSNTIGFDSDLTNKAVNNPTSVANNQNDLNSFLKQWNASYAGPSSFENSDTFGDAAKAANEASQKGQQLNTTGGREQLLQDQFGVYGQGNKGLDQAILQNSSAFPQIQDQAKGFNSIQDYLSNTAKDVNTAATTAQATTQNTKTATQAPFTNALTNFQTDLNGKVATARDSATQQASKYQQNLASGDSAKVEADLKEAGVPQEQIKNIVSYLTSLNTDYQIKPNIDASNISNPSTDIRPENVASSDDYAKAQALQKLTGVDYGGVLNPANASQASVGLSPKINSSNIQDYLKQSLDIQDKSIQKGIPELKSLLPDISDVNKGKQVAQTYIDAFKRAGSPGYGSKNLASIPKQLQDLYGQAVQSLGNIYGSIQKNPDGSYSPNPKNAGASEIIKQIMYYTIGQ